MSTPETSPQRPYSPQGELLSWPDELALRNQRGARLASLLVLVLYPTFGLLDYLIAPPNKLSLLLSSRAVVVGLTALMWFSLKRPLFKERSLALTGGYMYLVALGICVMVWSLGGLPSPYYAGLTLVMIGSGLLYVWPFKTSAMVNGAICASWFAPQLTSLASPLHNEALITAISNGFFLFSAACILTAAQSFNYQRLYAQHHTQLELEETSLKLSEAHSALKQQEAFKSRFFANITHELKTPLALILSSLELMRRGELGETVAEQKSSIQQMERSGNTLLKLINDLLDISKLEESSLTLKVAEHDLVRWSREVMSDVKPLAERKDITVSLTTLSTLGASPSALRVFCDLDRLERVLVNLLSNAVKFTPERGRIEVRLTELSDRVRLEVQDSGQGFKQEQAERLFERFYQTDMGATRKFGGTGLGLSLAKELIDLHRGRLWATGEEGVGATFTLELLKGNAHFDERSLAEGSAQQRKQEARESGEWPAVVISRDDLPVTEAHISGEFMLQKHHLSGERRLSGEHTIEPQNKPQNEPQREDVTLSVELNSKRQRLVEIEVASERRVVPRDADEDERGATVLIAEDHPDITRMIHLALRRHFKVVAAPDGAKALELVARFQPQLIITDLMMPVLDGIGFVEALKEREETAQIPVIMLSARDEVRQEMIERGCVADAYMSKPFSTRALSKLARQVATR